MKALIDADSIVYIIAWNYRDGGTEEEVKRSCDNFLKDMMTLLRTTTYIGAFSAPSDSVFRSGIYRYAQYKGKRPEKSENVQKWEPVIKNHLMMKYGFILLPKLEADDIIGGVASLMLKSGDAFVICSPDKDLRQIPGYHFDYRTPSGETPNSTITDISHAEAHWNFWLQMLTGDEGDNVSGVPGLGAVKAKKLLQPLMDDQDMVTTRTVVLSAYHKYFGEFYGNVIFAETEMTLRLMSPTHRLWTEFSKSIEWASTQWKELVATATMFDISS